MSGGLYRFVGNVRTGGAIERASISNLTLAESISLEIKTIGM